MQNYNTVGSISPTYLRAAFMPVAPKSVRIQSNCQYLFMLFGIYGRKRARRTLMKLTQGTCKGAKLPLDIFLHYIELPIQTTKLCLSI